MWKVFFFVFLFSATLCFSQRKNPSNLIVYKDTLLFARKSLSIVTFPNHYIFPSEAKSDRDTNYYKSIYFRNDFPIQRKYVKAGDTEKIEIDSLFINSYSGVLYLENFRSHFTYFNPIDDLKTKDFWEVPKSVMYFQNPAKVEIDLDQFQLSTSEVSRIDINDYFEPFFFQNEEITNLMYHQFVYYVRDSLARTLLSENMNVYDWKIPTYDTSGNEKDQEEWILNWETKIDWEKYAGNTQYEYLSELFLGESDRYYNRIEFDIRRLRYKPIDHEDDTITINVYPDTLRWIHDFDEAKLENNSELYFWHPAYDNYPVIGVNWYQAKAYCAWMTKEANKYFSKYAVGYKIKYDLPSIIQWDYVRRKSMEQNKILMLPRFNWETNLVLTEHQSIPLHDEKDTAYRYDDFLNAKGKFTRGNVLNNQLSDLPYISSYRELILNGSLPYLLNRDYKKMKKTKRFDDYDVSNVKFMGNSVSEWLQESYEENWELMYYKRMELLIKSAGADTDIQALREEYFNAYNHPKGKMVIGANWYDFRDEYYEGKSFESMDAKVFADPQKGFATVGFRIIATFEPIEK